MPVIRFARVLSLPETPVPETVYIVPKAGNTATLHIFGMNGESKVIEGFTYEQIKAIARNTTLTNLNPSLQGSVTATDTVETAIGKLQRQATDFGASAQGQAVWSATNFTSVPTTFRSQYIIVTSPHRRMFTWDGMKYVRAPWNLPGIVQYTYHNPSSLEGHLPIRADVSYAKASYPDLVAALGLTGTGNFTLVEMRGEFIRVLDNGRGVDVSRGVLSGQGDATLRVNGTIIMHQEAIATNIDGVSGAFTSGRTISGSYRDGGTQLTGAGSIGIINYDNATQVPVAGEIRPRNIALPAWISY